MSKLDDLFDLLDLKAAIAGGYVRRQVHPTLPLAIYNYAELTQFERAWSPVTRTCRGLIAHAETGEVLARPFRKFHNHDEPDAPTFELDEPVIVTDKLDGSLGIVYPTGDGGHAVATRGSFASEQAQHATAVWQARYADHVQVPADVTPLFEIIYPANRIVVDYQGLDDLVLLGGVQISTGEPLAPDYVAELLDWRGPVTETFTYRTFGEALQSEPRPGREGYVIRSLRSAETVKFKQAEYVRLHKIVTGLNARGVWEALGEGRTAADLIADLPDEFHPWVQEVADALTAQVSDIAAAAAHEHRRILAGLPEGWTRKDYALLAKDSAHRGYLFRLLDNRDLVDMTWKAVKPGADWTPAGRTFSEEAA